jgi:hypothetical protein
MAHVTSSFDTTTLPGASVECLPVRSATTAASPPPTVSRARPTRSGRSGRTCAMTAMRLSASAVATIARVTATDARSTRTRSFGRVSTTRARTAPPTASARAATTSSSERLWRSCATTSRRVTGWTGDAHSARTRPALEHPSGSTSAGLLHSQKNFQGSQFKNVSIKKAVALNAIGEEVGRG